MAGSKNQKAPSQALRAAQLQNTYVQLKRTRSDALSSTEVSKLEAALSNDASYGWSLTSNLRILRKNSLYHIVVNRREKAERTTGKPMFSSRCADQNSAEKAAFEVRYSNEAGTGKRKVDDWLDFKFPSPTGKTITRKLSVPEMKARLDAEKLNSDGKRQVLFERCGQAGLPVKLIFPVMTLGYVGKPKGAAHIAFKRGFFTHPSSFQMERRFHLPDQKYKRQRQPN
jgi:hypothetical protein